MLARAVSNLRRAVTVAIAVAAVACVTPSVPIPPPDPDHISFSVDADEGLARLSFAPDPSYGLAVVYVFNRDAGAGIITTAEEDGSVRETDPFPGQPGDDVIVTFEVETQIASTCVKLQDGRSSSALECTL